MLVSKFAKDINGKSVDLKSDEAAYRALCAIDADDRTNKCVVANVNGKSTVFIVSKDVNTDKNNRNWHQTQALANLPVHSDGRPFYVSGTVFDVKSTFAELYHEEDPTDYHGAFAGVEMKEIFIPDIENPPKSVADAIEKGARRQADFRVEEGRTSDGYAFNTIRILNANMSEQDRAYCENIAASHGMQTIYSSDGRAGYRVNRQQKQEIEAGASGGKPTRDYYGTLLRARDEFAARGMDTSELDKKIEARSRDIDAEFLAVVNAPDFSIYKYYKATEKESGELLQVFSTQENIIEPLAEVDFLDTYDSDKYEIATISKDEYARCKAELKQKAEEKIRQEKVFSKKDFEKICSEQGVTIDNVKEFTVPDGFTTIGTWAFSKCDSLEKITLPASVNKIGTGAFSFNKQLKEVDIKGDIEDMGVDVFSGCVSLEKIHNFPDKIDVISAGTFYNCSSLKAFHIPESVSAIGTNAFGCCKSLEEISIPDSVTEICYGAFLHCDSLGKVTANTAIFNEIKCDLPADCVRVDYEAAEKLSKKHGKKVFTNVDMSDVVDKNDVIKPVKRKTAGKDRSAEVEDLSVVEQTGKDTPAD